MRRIRSIVSLMRQNSRTPPDLCIPTASVEYIDDKLSVVLSLPSLVGFRVSTKH